MPEPAAPPAEERQSAVAPSELDELERQLADAEAALNQRLAEGEQRQLALESGQSDNGTAPAEGAPPAAAPAAAPASPSGAGAGAPAAERHEVRRAEKTKKENGRSSCDLACRAMASMRRSAGRICEILSSDDERCVKARRRVTDAERRIGESECRCAR